MCKKLQCSDTVQLQPLQVGGGLEQFYLPYVLLGQLTICKIIFMTLVFDQEPKLCTLCMLHTIFYLNMYALMIMQSKTTERFLHDLCQLCWQRCITLTIYFVPSHETHGSHYVMNCQSGSKKPPNVSRCGQNSQA